MKAAFCTLGCKVNQYETQAMRELFERAGYETAAFDEPADVYVVNTCTVTQTGDKKSRQMISRAHALNPAAKVVVVGCYSQIAPEEVKKLPGVWMVLGTKERARIVELFEASLAGERAVSAVETLDRGDDFEQISATHEDKARAHLKIQDGCDRFCTYCIIPFARGAIRSRPLESVREEMGKLAAAGYAEIVLTGIHVMSYGRDFHDGTTLADAFRLAEDIPAIKRVRLGSLEPNMADAAFVEAVKNSVKVCRHFHLSLQSGSASVLKRMNRRYTPEEYEACVNRLRAAMPGCAITTDVIVGFPGETEEEFAQTEAFLKKLALSRIHVFPYSARKGTKAAAMAEQIGKSVKAARVKRLIALGNELETAYLNTFAGTEQEVLFEECEGNRVYGHTGTYARVCVEGGEELIGAMCGVKIERVEKGCLYGTLSTRG
ncbi:MAG: tRNA (N(6)-L-threonylcarbamoyladenosine(37)-C(2))-methylthiotransferase MtaB [Clostridiaceae bacterium]|nr:tRNA (N(6)-L-threonylcarbamoyladenosine(37)-C(2))-methylthiotransferase MtaB [Eubacteriales bacterium]